MHNEVGKPALCIMRISTVQEILDQIRRGENLNKQTFPLGAPQFTYSDLWGLDIVENPQYYPSSSQQAVEE